MLDKALKRNEIIWLLLGGLLLGGIELVEMIPQPPLQAAARVMLIFVATGVGVYRKPS